MRISDWSSDVCSSDLGPRYGQGCRSERDRSRHLVARDRRPAVIGDLLLAKPGFRLEHDLGMHDLRSEEHTSELQSLMRISYAVFCLKKKKKQTKSIQNKINRDMHELINK